MMIPQGPGKRRKGEMFVTSETRLRTSKASPFELCPFRTRFLNFPAIQPRVGLVRLIRFKGINELRPGMKKKQWLKICSLWRLSWIIDLGLFGLCESGLGRGAPRLARLNRSREPSLLACSLTYNASLDMFCRTYNVILYTRTFLIVLLKPSSCDS